MKEWVLNSSSNDFWLLACLLIVLTITCFVCAFYYFNRKRIMQDIPTSKIRSCPQGYVELQGYGDLMEGPPIVAPLTGKTCTWYSYKIEEYRRTGKQNMWVTVDAGKSEELFIIEDESGKCIIDPEGAHVTTKEKDVWHGNTNKPTSGPATSSGIFSMRGSKYRYFEQRLIPKEVLYSIGLFKTVGGTESVSVDAEVRDLVKQWKSDTHALLQRFDKNKDGEFSLQEWEKVREAALNHVLAERKESHKVVNMLGKTMDRRRPFILSAVPQKSLIKKFQLYSVASLILFFVSGGLATWAISLRLAGT